MSLFLTWLALAVASPPDAPAPIERSVVRLVNTGQRPTPLTPWNAGRVRTGTGTGFVIDGGRILTNAHVVSNSRMLQLYFLDDPTPHEAEVIVAGHDCDLAIVQPKDPTLLQGRPALSIGGMPELRSQVVTYGYPAGGKRMSSTSGVVSRIEVNAYVQAPGWRHLTVQTDAAINPGNSGGPVMQGREVMGVAFQTHLKLDDVGHFIPTEIVRHFLTDIEDGTYDGFPSLGISVSNLDNPAAQRRAGLPEGRSGVTVDFIVPGSTAEGHLQAGDVLLSMGGTPIANDGTVERFGQRLHRTAVLDRYQYGQPLPVQILRDGAVRSLQLPLAGNPNRDRYGPRWDRPTRFYVYAGLIFVPIDRALLTDLGSKAPEAVLYEAYLRPFEDPDFDKQESVLLLDRLEHSVNTELAWFRRKVVETINGKPIRRLEDVIDALEGQQGPVHVLEYAHHQQLGVLDRAAADAAHAEILEEYGLSRDRRLR